MPRSSITISDEPLSRETNYRTEFVVVLNNQPQGGLAMRPRSPPVHLARSTASETTGSGFNQQRNWGFQSDNARGPTSQQFYDRRQDVR
jgi:hypothetical protein